MSNLFSLDFPFPMAKEDMNNPIERIMEDTRELPIRENPTIKPSSNGNSKSTLQGSGFLDEQINAGARQVIEEWRGNREQRQQVEQQHLIWLRKQEGTKLIWTPIKYKQLEEEIARDESGDFENVTWQSPTSREALELATHLRNSWDEDSCLAFDYLIDTQDQVDQTGNLTHIEVDVEGHDRNGHRLRVQRTLEVKISRRQEELEGALRQKNMMQLEWTIILKKPHPFALPPQAARYKTPHQLILEQLAQHELDKAIDERNHFLRKTFGPGSDLFHMERESTLGAHDWSFHTPVVQIRGPDGVVLRLVECRTDAEVDGEVICTHRMSLTESIPSGEQSHLFDLPIEGTDTERRIRQARWSISSAIDRCHASGSAERFVMDKWVGWSF
ncbi:hypothetical protein LSUB1_G005809 [Lachnellula subtilissima]|uniref:Uncharacterized protein n=1 Tax=Lachnellula subtilissima TaxID=602034 RepID=A0A8H8RH92_9HELO|nr:hypothetical protein LSUB1_G005809 [Lachnellula subtilissima]